VQSWPDDIFPAITGNPVRLWRRAEASLRFLPDDRSAQVWAAIIMAARYDRDRAKQWVTENSSTINATERATIDRLLGQIEQPTTNPVMGDNPEGSAASVPTLQE
jgi:hypothetical protein